MRPQGVVVGQLLGASGVVSGHLGVIVCDGVDEGLIVLLYQVVGGGQTLRGLLRILRQLGQSTMTAAIVAEVQPKDRQTEEEPKGQDVAERLPGQVIEIEHQRSGSTQQAPHTDALAPPVEIGE